jgi:glycine/D-amino acid oxidase-like deaminating enzyme
VRSSSGRLRTAVGRYDRRAPAPRSVREARRERAVAALADAHRRPLWLDGGAPPAAPPLVRAARCDLLVVGGGFTGLWTALRAAERHPELEVVLVEGRRVAWAAAGRNGGFCEASLTHGLSNGVAHFPREVALLERLGLENLDAIEATVVREGIDCGFERTGTLDVATAAWQLEELAELAALAAGVGEDVRLLDAAACRAEVDSPTYLGGLSTPERCALVDPARLAWGLLAAAKRRGVAVHEGTRVVGLEDDGDGVAATLDSGARVRARRVVLATGAFAPLLRRLRYYVVPVYDYALATEPLGASRLARIGWRNRQGISDGGNQFHYYRLTPDDRILFGGYDAVYHFGSAVRERHEQRDATFLLLAEHFFETFPSLEDVRFEYRWGGVIDTCTRFTPFFGRALGGRVVYAAGFTGLGVGASRFAGEVLVDLATGEASERSRLEMVRRKPVPFPPEPFRWLVIEATRRSLAAADRNCGRRNAWLRVLDRLGIGFDS